MCGIYCRWRIACMPVVENRYSGARPAVEDFNAPLNRYAVSAQPLRHIRAVIRKVPVAAPR
jgi:hypothetical protein